MSGPVHDVVDVDGTHLKQGTLGDAAAESKHSLLMKQCPGLISRVEVLPSAFIWHDDRQLGTASVPPTFTTCAQARSKRWRLEGGCAAAP